MGDTAIIVAIITGIASVLGVILTNVASNNKMEQNIVTSQAVTDAKIENLTEEVRKHNNFAQKIPVLETKVATLERDVQDLKNK